MILETSTLDDLPNLLERCGLGRQIHADTKVAIKINLAKPPEVQIPRTDPAVLEIIVRFLNDLGSIPTIIEAADGFLEQNLANLQFGCGLGTTKFNFIDLDLETATRLIANDGQAHYLPNCLSDYDVRIAVPGISYLPGLIFSNNIKLFVGLVPRRFYQEGTSQVGRPAIHEDLHRAVADIYQLVDRFAPFHFYINGGRVFLHHKPSIEQLPGFFVSDNGLELDLHLLKVLEIAKPEYVSLLMAE